VPGLSLNDPVSVQATNICAEIASGNPSYLNIEFIYIESRRVIKSILGLYIGIPTVDPHELHGFSCWLT